MMVNEEWFKKDALVFTINCSESDQDKKNFWFLIGLLYHSVEPSIPLASIP